MHAMQFSKILPSGNTTIILEDPTIDNETLPHISARLMNSLHLGAEQVGLLRMQHGTIPHLQMMGGEFCVNATRATAFVLARKHMLAQLNDNCFYGELSVSGAQQPLLVFAAHTASALEDAISKHIALSPKRVQSTASFASINATSPTMHCAACLACEMTQLQIETIDAHATLVHMPGISHLLLNASHHTFHSDWQKDSNHWRKHVGIHSMPASGVIWYQQTDKHQYTIHPAVYVKATHSEHMETACGSASFAVACLHHAQALTTEAFSKTTKNLPAVLSQVHVTQPSGYDLSITIFVPVNSQNNFTIHAFVAGQVSLIAEGTTCLS